MTLKQISELLNTTIVPNTMGAEATIAEDLSNITELGKAITSIESSDLSNYAQNFIVGVARNFFDTREYKSVDLGLFIEAQKYGGVIQRVKAKLLDTQSDPIWTLANGQDYFDGKYYGVDISSKIYNTDTIYMIAHSIPSEEFKQYFTSKDGVETLISLIESTVQNTLNRNIHALAKRTLCRLIESCKGDRVLNLVALYNTTFGKQLTSSTALADKDFLKWSSSVIIRLRDYIQEYNTKYNDGEVEGFTPAEDTRVTLLSEFSTSLQFNMSADTFHKELVSVGEFNTVTSWQNPSNALLPTMGVSAQIKTKTSEVESTIENVVGVIYDKYSCGISARLNKTTAQYIAKGDYTTYFNHIADRSFVDTRNTGIVLTLN